MSKKKETMKAKAQNATVPREYKKLYPIINPQNATLTHVDHLSVPRVLAKSS